MATSGGSARDNLVWVRWTIVVVFLAYAPFYLVWRTTTFNDQAPIFSVVLWLAEIFGFVTAAMHIFMVARLTSPEPPEPMAELSVDVFVPTYNEEVSLLRHTLIAARDMAYPHQTWLLDDGNRPEMKNLAAEINCRYLAREDNKGAKAGNFNNALKHSSGELIAVFDADHVPNRSFLTRTLGFFRDSRVAFVQTPQDFYNLDSYQHRRKSGTNYIWTEQSLFFRVIQRGKDYWNAAFFCGSCAVIRRSALEDVGGFAEETITEDLHTSIKLHKKGYRSVYLPESLAFGLAPSSIHAFLLQRLRWGRGAMHVWRIEGLVFSRGLSIAQRINYLASVLTYFDGWQKAIFYLAPVIVLTTGIMPIAAVNITFLQYFIPYYVLSFWVYEELSRGYGQTLLTEQYNMARFTTFLRATLPTFRSKGFRVTPKGTKEGNQDSRLTPEFAVFAISSLAILIGVVLWFRTHHLPQSALIANIIWGGINIGLAGAVIRFSLGRRQRRSEYRFQLPVPGWVVEDDQKKIMGIAENISAGGCTLVIEAPLSHSTVTGSLVFPQGQIDFRAAVRRVPEKEADLKDAKRDAVRDPRRKYAYGLEFIWENQIGPIELENYLYGSNSQWELLGLRERARTPASRLLSWAERGHFPRLPRGKHIEWSPFIYAAKSSEPMNNLGVMFHESGKIKRAIFFRHVPDNTVMRAKLFGYGEEGAVNISLGGLTQLLSSSTPVYAGDVRLEPENSRQN